MLCEVNELAAPALAELARTIPCREVALNTPLRPSAAKAISPGAMQRIKRLFAPLPVRTVYDAPPVDARAVDAEKTAWRRPGGK